MPTYLVRWEIDIDAKNPIQAAKLALETQLDPGRCWSGVFDVTNSDGRVVRVDLDEKPVTVELITPSPHHRE